MANLSLPAKYAEAFFSAATDTGVLAQAAADLKLIKKTLDSNTGLKKILFHPGIDKNDKYGMITSVFSNDIGMLAANLLKLLVFKRREPLFDDIHGLFFERMSEMEGTHNIILETAMPLDETERSALVSSLEKAMSRTLTVETRINPELIGGIRIRERLRQIDASALQFVHSMKEELMNVKVISQEQNSIR